MDILTQGVLGATVGYAVSSKSSIGKKKSTICGFLFGLIPDLDLAVQQFIHHPWVEHRGISHSLFFAPFVALIFASFMKYKKGQSFHDWFYLAFWTLITHPILDLFTGSGTPLLLPLSNYQFALSSVAVIDLSYSVPLFISFLLILFLKNEKISGMFNRVVLFFTTIYLFLGIEQQDLAVQKIKSESKIKGWTSDCKIYPNYVSIFRRRAICFNKDSIFDTYFYTFDKNIEWKKIDSQENMTLKIKSLNDFLK